MLRINRRAGESIIITTNGGDKVVITLDEIDGNFVRLSLEAPRRVKIDRKEIYDARSDDVQGH